jgi:hypothetical protein
MQLAISSPGNGTLGALTTHTHNVTDNETMPTVQFAAATSSAHENTTPHDIDVTLSGAAQANVTVYYSVTGGTATGSGTGTDYTLAAGTLTFSGAAAGGSTSEDISIAVVDDGPGDAGETIALAIASPATATLGTQTTHTHTLTELNNGIVASALATSAITSTSFNAQISFLGDDNANATVTLYWCNQTDSAGCNPETANGVSQGSMAMTRGAGVFTASISGLAYPNEPGDTLNVRVVAADVDGVTGSPLNTTITLLPTLDIAEMAKREGESFAFVVQLNRPSAANVTFSYTTSSGTATSGTDFTAAGPLTGTILAGQTSVTLPAINTNDDGSSESTETFNLTISAPTQATIRTAVAKGYILDNDPGLAWAKGFDNSIMAISPQSDGKRVVGGYLTGFDSTINNQLVRINSNGSEDVAMQPWAGLISMVNVSLRQPDGKILLGGESWTDGVTSRNNIVRLNADGTLDTTFDPGVGFDGVVHAMHLQRDGKILVGAITTINWVMAPPLRETRRW